ncbi:hypothetical protein F2P56_008960 [Juglans regia]|uniref:Reverse transcriptase domain-containing protein n=1 Tax=Juglans regia TaxID=51240 RepID=A0A833XSP5_JUGRE|nr:hypothetical protein F2P56_008960 [Juglans regia]
MSRINNLVIGHSICINLKAKKVRQKRRSFSIEKWTAIAKEIDSLLAIGFIREAHYLEWLSNVVLIRKANSKWRMCMDFIDLNKTCPKDSFPLPQIDIIVDATIEQKSLSFMEAYSEFNQIRMNKANEEKTAFITDRWHYCYRVLPFGLKNTGATYQRLVNQMFKHQIRKTIEVYVDDQLVKSKEATQQLEHPQWIS